MSRVCANCGKPIQEGSKFCSYCGQSIESLNDENEKENNQKEQEECKTGTLAESVSGGTKQNQTIINMIDDLAFDNEAKQEEIHQSLKPLQEETDNLVEKKKAYQGQSKIGKIKEFREKFLKIKGRLNRQEYILRNIPVLYIFLFGGIFDFKGVATYFLFISMILWTMLTIRRCHDMNLSGWFSLIGYIPYVNLVFLFALLVIKGTDGPNKYGLDPLQNN